MAVLRKGNRQLTVSESAAAGYLQQGYLEVDGETGQPLHPVAPGGVRLEQELAAARAEAAARGEELAAVQKELAEAKAALAASGPSASPKGGK